MNKKKSSTSSLGATFKRWTSSSKADQQPYLGLLDGGQAPGAEIICVKAKYFGCVPTQKLGSFAKDALDCSQRLLAVCKHPQKVKLVITTLGVYVLQLETEHCIVKAPVKDSINFVGMKKSAKSKHPKVACFLKRGEATLYDAEPHYGFVLEFKNEDLLKQVNNGYSDMVQNQVRNELYQFKEEEEGATSASTHDDGGDGAYMDLPPPSASTRAPMMRRFSSTHI